MQVLVGQGLSTHEKTAHIVIRLLRTVFTRFEVAKARLQKWFKNGSEFVSNEVLS